MKMLVMKVTGGDDLDGGPRFAALPLTTEMLEGLLQLAEKFRQCKRIYENLYETYEFNYDCLWFDLGDADGADADGADLDELAYGPCERLVATLDEADDESPPWLKDMAAMLDYTLERGRCELLLAPSDQIPEEANLRTECDQMRMNLKPLSLTPRPDGDELVEFQLLCLAKHTDVELRATTFNSDDVKGWLAAELMG